MRQFSSNTRRLHQWNGEVIRRSWKKYDSTSLNEGGKEHTYAKYTLTYKHICTYINICTLSFSLSFSFSCTWPYNYIYVNQPTDRYDDKLRIEGACHWWGCEWWQKDLKKQLIDWLTKVLNKQLISWLNSLQND